MFMVAPRGSEKFATLGETPSFSVVLAMVMGYGVGRYILYWWPDADVRLRVNVMATLLLLFGFVGMVIAVPITAVAGVLFRFFTRQYEKSPVYLGTETGEPES